MLFFSSSSPACFRSASDRELLRKLAPGVLWVSALLATMLSLPRLFADDYRDGTLGATGAGAATAGPHRPRQGDRALAGFGPAAGAAGAGAGVQFDLSAEALLVLSVSLLIGTPALSGIGAIGVALTLGLRGGGVLVVSLLVLPLYIPVLIFGAGAVDATIPGSVPSAPVDPRALAIAGVFFLQPRALRILE